MGETRTSSRLLGWLAAVVVLGACLAAGAEADERTPRAPVLKPERTAPATFHRADVVLVKFRDGQTVRCAEGVLTDFDAEEHAGAPQAMALVAGGTWFATQPLAPQTFDRLRRTAEETLNRDIADLNLEFFLLLPVGVSVAEACDAFNACEVVELARPVPEPPPSPVPGSFQGAQGYLNAAPGGIDALAAWPHTTGAGVQIADLEYSWNLAHQDLPPVTVLGTPGPDPFDDNHGTAVLGELVSVNNGWGTTGACYSSTCFVASPIQSTPGNPYNLATAIVLALGTLGPGDIILIEQQTRGPNYPGAGPQDGLVASEWNLGVYNAILTAIGNGVIVVEAAGNGSEDLDNAAFGCCTVVVPKLATVGYIMQVLADATTAQNTCAGTPPGSVQPDVPAGYTQIRGWTSVP